MKTKTIFKALAFVIVMPAMLLTTACSSSDDSIINDENINKKGFALPVTVNVTRQGDKANTRATYNETTKKLEFSDGDQLFVNGIHPDAGYFAGTLDRVSGGTFSGTILPLESIQTLLKNFLMRPRRAERTILPLPRCCLVATKNMIIFFMIQSWKFSTSSTGMKIMLLPDRRQKPLSSSLWSKQKNMKMALP